MPIHGIIYHHWANNKEIQYTNHTFISQLKKTFILKEKYIHNAWLTINLLRVSSFSN